MVTQVGVKADDKNCIRARTNADNFVITTWCWKFKRFRDLVKIPIGYTHAPYKIVNIGNMLLVEFF